MPFGAAVAACRRPCGRTCEEEQVVVMKEAMQMLLEEAGQRRRSRRGGGGGAEDKGWRRACRTRRGQGSSGWKWPH